MNCEEHGAAWSYQEAREELRESDLAWRRSLLNSDSNQPLDVFACEQCEKAFTSPVFLAKHIGSRHEQKAPAEVEAVGLNRVLEELKALRLCLEVPLFLWLTLLSPFTSISNGGYCSAAMR